MNIFARRLLSSVLLTLSITVVSILPSSVVAAPLFQDGTPAALVESKSKEGDRPSSFSALVKEVGHAVVNISVEGDNEAPAPSEGGAPQPAQPQLPFFRKDSSPLRSVGSGFISSSDGYVITNNHVIEKAKKIIVRIPDDKSDYPAKVIGIDPKTDLALIKIEPKAPLKTIYLGDSDTLEVGDWVIAVGNQFQLGQTVTAGIVSATSRRVPTGSPYDAFIQTDASINPGSSGGPLFNTKGQVVGINTAIFSPGRTQFGGTGFNIGIGFSIPINLARRVLTQLRDQGKVTRGLLGVMIQKVDNDMAAALGIASSGGALVSEIMPNTPAAAAGFLRGDVIVSYNGAAVQEHDDLPLLVANTPVGSTVSIELLRKGKRITVSALINELKDGDKKAAAEIKATPDALGLVVSPLTPEVAKVLKLDDGKGVLVESVEAGSPGDRSGLVRGDVILEIGHAPIASTERYQYALKNSNKSVPLLLLVKKQEGTRYLVVKVAGE
jgi:serine protease Do